MIPEIYLLHQRRNSDNDYAHFIYHGPVECIEFRMQQPAFREHISCAPAKEFIKAENISKKHFLPGGMAA